jgi:hypothetical protein
MGGVNIVRLHHKGEASPLPLNLIAQALPKLSRHELASLAERLVDRLDELDPDPDLEEDDPSGQCDEDERNTGSGVFMMHGTSYMGPGCPISHDHSSYY